MVDQTRFASLTRRILALALALCCLLPAATLAEDDTAALFAQRLEQLQTPAEAAIAAGRYELRTGNSAYFPYVSPGVIPYDQQAETPAPAPEGTFSSDDESVVTVDAAGLMTAIAAGETIVRWQSPEGEKAVTVAVSDDFISEIGKNYVYVLNREYFSVARQRLPKYNQYAKWYYRKKKEVGWCSVFTIYCANAAGFDPIEEKEIDPEAGYTDVFFREGQVGNQYDGFRKLGRFVGVPKPGYTVIYVDMSKAYLTTHIGSVVEVEDRGDGLYAVTTVEGNMSNTVKRYTYLYDSNKSNHEITTDTRKHLQENMLTLPESEHTDPLSQYELHTDHWSVFGFGATW
ncbi:MAG: Ig-like domain-containing protein [Clostridia bacterium]|nr:Ig-like domain-containing protein [Clostridia bacterium]